MVCVLPAEGMSTRAIAPIVGAARNTVMKDIREVYQNDTPAPKSDAELLAGAE